MRSSTNADYKMHFHVLLEHLNKIFQLPFDVYIQNYLCAEQKINNQMHGVYYNRVTDSNLFNFKLYNKCTYRYGRQHGLFWKEERGFTDCVYFRNDLWLRTVVYRHYINSDWNVQIIDDNKPPRYTYVDTRHYKKSLAQICFKKIKKN